MTEHTPIKLICIIIVSNIFVVALVLYSVGQDSDTSNPTSMKTVFIKHRDPVGWLPYDLTFRAQNEDPKYKNHLEYYIFEGAPKNYSDPALIRTPWDFGRIRFTHQPECSHKRITYYNKIYQKSTITLFLKIIYGSLNFCTNSFPLSFRVPKTRTDSIDLGQRRVASFCSFQCRISTTSTRPQRCRHVNLRRVQRDRGTDHAQISTDNKTCGIL